MVYRHAPPTYDSIKAVVSQRGREGGREGGRKGEGETYYCFGGA